MFVQCSIGDNNLVPMEPRTTLMTKGQITYITRILESGDRFISYEDIGFVTYASPFLDYLFISKDEMKDILRGTGWRIREFIESESVSYIAIIEKTSTRAVK